MYLDAYFEMQFYSECVKQTGAITIPGIRSCSGVVLTEISGGYTASALSTRGVLAGERMCFRTPVNAMTAQTAEIKITESNILVGSGTTPTTKSDYRLESEITAGLESIAIKCRYTIEEGAIEYAKNIENISGTNITISEIGLAWPCVDSYNSETAPQVLVYREVLPSPIVVAHGESFTVKIKHEFAMPTR